MIRDAASNPGVLDSGCEGALGADAFVGVTVGSVVGITLVSAVGGVGSESTSSSGAVGDSVVGVAVVAGGAAVKPDDPDDLWLSSSSAS